MTEDISMTRRFTRRYRDDADKNILGVERRRSGESRSPETRTPDSRTTSSRTPSSNTARRRAPSASDARRRVRRNTSRRLTATQRLDSGEISRAQYRRIAAERVRRAKKRRTKQLITRAALLAAAVLIAAFVVFEILPVKSKVKAEVGTDVKLKDFLRINYPNSEFTKDSEQYDVNKAGEYNVKIRSGIFSHKSKLIIEDNAAPEFEIHDLIIGVNDTCKAEDFVSDIKDASETEVRFKAEPDYSKKDSEQELSIVVKDSEGNESEKQAKLRILPINYLVQVETGSDPVGIWNFVDGAAEDTEETKMVTDPASLDYYAPGAVYDVEVMYNGVTYPGKVEIIDTLAPEFISAEDFTAFLGDSIHYKDHVTVADNSGAYELDVDTSQVDQEKEGTYEVTYTATDERGNSSSATVKVTIVAKTASEQELFDYIDLVLADLLTDEMSTADKAWAIYEYIRSNVTFINYSDKGDYALAATQALREGQGDCYAFFSVAKAMLTRAGINNFDIEVKTDTQEHYWNAVDIGDGHGWYHYDTTPTANALTIFLWTDEEVERVNDGRWSYDKSAYPPIP